jgi:hypothetical protein
MSTTLPASLARVSIADPVRVSGFGQNQQPPLSLNACFAEFLRRIVPTSPAYVAAKHAAARIAADLRAEFYRNPSIDVTETDHIVAGSVGKRTAVAPIRCADLLYALPPKLGISQSVDALNAALAVLRQRHPDALLTPDHTGVMVPTSAMIIKVVPCVPRDGAFLVPGLATPTRPQGWSLTNPIAEAATLRLMDSMYASRPRLMLAVLKSWKANCEVPISSFALELMTMDFYSSAPRAFDLGAALIDFWAWSRKRTPVTLKPPGASTAVAIDDSWHGKAKAAYWRATMAEYHVNQGKGVEAALEWRSSLGPLFPVPGEQIDALPLFPDKRRKQSAA